MHILCTECAKIKKNNSGAKRLNIARGMFRLKLQGLQGPSISCMFWIYSLSKSETRLIGRDVFASNDNGKGNFIPVLHISMPWISSIRLCNYTVLIFPISFTSALKVTVGGKM